MNQFTNEHGELMDITKENLSYAMNTFLFKHSQLCQKLLGTFSDTKAINSIICRTNALHSYINESEYTIALALHILKRYPEIMFRIEFYDINGIVLELSENNAQFFLDNIFTTEPFKRYQRILNSNTHSYDAMSLEYLVNAYFTRRFNFLKNNAMSSNWNPSILRDIFDMLNFYTPIYMLKSVDTEFANLHNDLLKLLY